MAGKVKLLALHFLRTELLLDRLLNLQKLILANLLKIQLSLETTFCFDFLKEVNIPCRALLWEMGKPANTGVQKGKSHGNV